MGRLEARTEDLFKEKLIAAGYTQANGITVDRQTCSLSEINKYFSNASKNDESNRPGYPDYIITNNSYPGIVMLAECKADNSDHEKALKEVQHYAKELFGKYDVVLFAVSGTTDTTLKIESAIVRKNMTVVNKSNSNGYNFEKILDLHDYEKIIGYTNQIEQDLISKLNEIKENVNEILYEAGDLNADKRMLVLSACLIGLNYYPFRTNYWNYSPEDLVDYLIDAVDKSLAAYGIPQTKRNTMIKNFETIKQVEALNSGIINECGALSSPLKDMLGELHDLHNIIQGNNHSFSSLNIDVMGKFYDEFITHGKGMDNAKNGFVLTPRHVCELFADLGELDVNTKVLDMCFGTGGFLIAAMQNEIIKAKGDKAQIKNIKDNNICGVELNGDRFTYGCVNMILRGDGQSNMIQGNCFDPNIKRQMIEKQCKVGFINPPYALSTNELAFVENMLDCLEVGGRGIAIIPSSCTGNKNGDYRATRERILSKHTLEAVLSMPDQLFYPVGTITCIMIFTAHKPHSSDKKTWFARCKDDGFEINKKFGRADIKGKWADIKKQWLDAFINRDEIPGFSLKRSVTADNEWSYEAYAKTDFSGITEESFKKVIKEYALFLLGQAEI